MAKLSAEAKAELVEQLSGLARQLRDLSSTAGAEHKQAIIGFAAQAAGYAAKLKKADSPQQAALLKAEVDKKRPQWEQLLAALAFAEQMENPESEAVQAAIKEAEAKLRATAEGLRTAAQNGANEASQAIDKVATMAEEGLAEFLAAETPQEKFQIYARLEEAKGKWLSDMQNMKSDLEDRHTQAEAQEKQRAAAHEALLRAAAGSGWDNLEAKGSTLKAATEAVSCLPVDDACMPLGEADVFNATYGDAVCAPLDAAGGEVFLDCQEASTAAPKDADAERQTQASKSKSKSKKGAKADTVEC